MNVQVSTLTASALLWSLASVHALNDEQALAPRPVALATTAMVTQQPSSNAIAPAVGSIDIADPALVKKWGIRIESLRLTAAGYMLDLRYRVVDARKAKPLFERRTKPVLRDEASGVQLAVPVPPKTGALRNSNDPKAGRSYFMFFANPARFVKPGNRVTITIGTFSVSGIPVDGETAREGA